MCAGHFCFQCSHAYNESLVSYNSSDANSEVIEYVLYEGAHELLRKIMILMMSSDDEFVQMAYESFQYIVEYCQEHLGENALVLESKARCKAVVPEDNHLQESRDENEEHKGEVDKERYDTNIKFTNDASLFSNDSYYAQTADNCSAEAMCLDTGFGSVNIDELEIEPCYEYGTNMQGEECHDNSSVDELVGKSHELATKGERLEEENTLLHVTKEEYYEVFPYKGNQGKILEMIHDSLTLLLQLHKEICSLYWVHQHLLGSEDLFIYMMPMHRKRVRLKPRFAERCSN
jgi:hypothetical protein